MGGAVRNPHGHVCADEVVLSGGGSDVGGQQNSMIVVCVCVCGEDGRDARL